MKTQKIKAYLSIAVCVIFFTICIYSLFTPSKLAKYGKKSKKGPITLLDTDTKAKIFVNNGNNDKNLLDSEETNQKLVESFSGKKKELYLDYLNEKEEYINQLENMIEDKKALELRQDPNRKKKALNRKKTIINDQEDDEEAIELRNDPNRKKKAAARKRKVINDDDEEEALELRNDPNRKKKAAARKRKVINDDDEEALELRQKSTNLDEEEQSEEEQSEEDQSEEEQSEEEQSEDEKSEEEQSEDEEESVELLKKRSNKKKDIENKKHNVINEDDSEEALELRADPNRKKKALSRKKTIINDDDDEEALELRNDPNRKKKAASRKRKVINDDDEEAELIEFIESKNQKINNKKSKKTSTMKLLMIILSIISFGALIIIGYEIRQNYKATQKLKETVINDNTNNFEAPLEYNLIEDQKKENEGELGIQNL
jgi:hypothetical protein